MNPREANLELLARFFEKYPDYADKAFLSVKGGINTKTNSLDGSSVDLSFDLLALTICTAQKDSR